MLLKSLRSVQMVRRLSAGVGTQPSNYGTHKTEQPKERLLSIQLL